MSRNISIARAIQKEISSIISEKVKADLGVVSVSRVEVSGDLSYAKIYLSFFGQDRGHRFERIEKASGFIRRELAKVLKIKHIPQLQFINDFSLEEGNKILNKLNSLNIPDEKSNN